MSLTDALDLVSHPSRWTVFSRPAEVATPVRTKGLLARLSQDQKAALFRYQGLEASGDQSLPKRAR
jgi:hypothetical protein